MRTFRVPSCKFRVTGSLLGLSLLAWAISTEAATYYVATTGDDANPGTITEPWRTLQHAVFAMGPGDTILVRAGTYGGFELIDAGGGSPGAPKTIKAYPGETVTLDRAIIPTRNGVATPIIYLEGPGTSHLVIDGFKMTDTGTYTFSPLNITDGSKNDALCNQAANEGPGISSWAIKMDWHSTNTNVPDDITIQHNEIYRMNSIAISGVANGLKLLNNHIHHNTRMDLGTFGGGYGTYIEGNNGIVRGNVVHDNNSVGLRFACDPVWGCFGWHNSIIEHNMIYNNYGRIAHGGDYSAPCDWDSGGYGLIINGGTGNIVRNNMIYGNALNEVWGERQGQWGIYIFPRPGTINGGPNKVYNNTVWNHGSGPGAVGIKIEDGYGGVSGNEVRNNISWQNGTDIYIGTLGVGSDNLTTDPQFVNAASGDLHLQPDSPAIDAGVILPDVPTDFDGVSRPQGSGYDIGAYEFTVEGTLRGDLNGDGKRDLTDVRWMIEMLVGTRPKTPEADLTGDGAVTLADVQALIRLMVGLP